ncbi:MAG: type III-B CRISPR module RAMP protein Cmr1 [Actinobacteria bacterium]|nr:type III-B CRISPR module RAMP protein Cmr1 [Actinomycetota bacterium]
MNNEHTIEIKMLTPLWTGGVDGKCDRLHETGIIGSMRWWYEAIVRALDGYTCDPTSKDHCELSGKEKTEEERRKKLCPACWLFGCGGWKRRFRLDVLASSTEPFSLSSLFYKNQRNQEEFNRWWLKQVFNKNLNDNLPIGDVKFSIQPSAGNEEIILGQVKALISAMAQLGALGAKAQYGFGQFERAERQSIQDVLCAINDFVKAGGFLTKENDAGWYSLENYWLYELSLPTSNPQVKRFEGAKLIGSTQKPLTYLPVSFDIRYKLPGRNNLGLRQAYRQSHTKEQTRKVFGTLTGEKQGSRVFVSHLFKQQKDEENYYLRVWGFTEDIVRAFLGEELKRIFGLETMPGIKFSGAELIRGIKQGGCA